MNEEKFFMLCATILLSIGIIGTVAVEVIKAMR